MTIESELAQEAFMLQGGIYARIVAKLKEQGIIDRSHIYREYPKRLYLNPREVEIERHTKDCENRIITWMETKTVYDEVEVGSEEEEERVTSGGKTSAQMEQDRQDLIRRCAAAGVRADPSWSAVRLRRELGDKMDEPAPRDEMGALKEKLAHLQEMADMRAKIAALEAQLAAPADDAEALREELTAAGVRVDRRWSAARLREELDRATAPQGE